MLDKPVEQGVRDIAAIEPIVRRGRTGESGVHAGIVPGALLTRITFRVGRTTTTTPSRRTTAQRVG